MVLKDTRKHSTSDLSEDEQYIMTSSCFLRAMEQPHHGNTTVGRHSIEVKDFSLAICRALARKEIVTDERSVLIAALCHDLGMVGRYEKYRNNLECCFRHPVDSVEEARKLYPEMDSATEDIIRNHMWPLAVHRPRSLEGYIVSLADKRVSMQSAFFSGERIAGTDRMVRWLMRVNQFLKREGARK